MNQDERLEYARLVLSRSAPYLAHILWQLVFVNVADCGDRTFLTANGAGTAEQAIPTVAVDSKGILYYNSGFLSKLKNKEVVFVVAHESLHLLLRGHERAVLFGKAKHVLWNIAQDLEINQLLSSLPNVFGKMPECAVTPGDRPFEDLQFGLTADDYYHILLKKYPDDGSEKSIVCGSIDEHFSGDDAGSDINEDELPDWVQDIRKKRSKFSIENAAKLARQAVKQHGNLPGADKLSGLLGDGEAKIPWQHVLSSYVGKSINRVQGYSEHSYRVLARRQHVVGYDKCLIPGTYSPKIKTLVVIDTSASMSKDDINNGLSETRGVLGTEADVKFTSCDTQTYSVEDITTVEQARNLLKGGGGTDFMPVFDLAEKEGVDLVILITDGYGPAPETSPDGHDTIWLTTTNYCPVTWGKHIIMS